MKAKILKQYQIPGGQCILFTPSRDNRQSIAIVKQDGRFPAGKRFDVDKIHTQTIFVLKGKFNIVCNGQKSIIKKGDVFFIETGRKHAIEGKGTNLVAITPAIAK